MHHEYFSCLGRYACILFSELYEYKVYKVIHLCFVQSISLFLLYVLVPLTYLPKISSYWISIYTSITQLSFSTSMRISLSTLLLVAGRRSNWRTRRACSICRTSDCGRTRASRTCPSPRRRGAAGRVAAGRGRPPPPPALAARSWTRLRNALVPRRSPSRTPGGNETPEKSLAASIGGRSADPKAIQTDLRACFSIFRLLRRLNALMRSDF